MTSKKSPPKETAKAPFVLPAVVDIARTLMLSKEFSDAIQHSNHLTVDATGVERITTPGIQLLIAVHKELSESNGSLVITASSPAFREAFDSVGLTEYYHLWRKA